MPYSADSLIAQNPEWRYADFEQQAFQISHDLQQRKVNTIALWLEDSAILACTILAAWHANVKVLFPPNSTSESLDWVKANADLLVVDNSDIQGDNCVPFAELGSSLSKQECQKFAENRPLFDRQNQTEIWLKTSGSTGEAKTIVKTAEQMWLGAEALALSLPFKAGNQTTAISTVSIQHVYGLTVHIMMSLVNGWQIGRKQQFYPECIALEAQKAEQAVIISSPAMLSRIHWDTANLPHSIQGVISSGGALADEVSTQMRQCLQQPVVEIYGSTETGPIAIRDDIHHWQILKNSTLGTDENGALWIEATWLSQREQTADVVEFDEQGFRLLGRADRIVKIGDKRTSLVSIENQLNKHCYVDDCYIAQHPEQPRLAAWVGLTADGIEMLREKGRRALIAELKLQLASSQEKSAIPRFWRFTDKLPRNSQSKINKLEFNRTCVEKITDPIWLSEHRNGNEFIATGKVPLDLVYLKDHFSTFPLVPGVVELQWTSDKFNEFVGKEMPFSRIDKLKYQRFVRPNDQFELSLHWQQDKDRVVFKITIDGEICCSGIAIFA